MKAGSHARDDGSFGRSAGTQTLKGAALLILALVIGVVLLRTAPHNSTSVSTLPGLSSATTSPSRSSSGGSPTTVPTTAPSTTSPPAHAADEVHLLVANGAGVAGLAGKIRGQLNAAGYNTDKPAINSPTSVATTGIYYQPGFEADAVAVAQTLGLGPANVSAMPTPPPVAASDLTAVDVLVVAGSDLAAADTSDTTEAPPGATVAPSAGTVASSGTPTTTT